MMDLQIEQMEERDKRQLKTEPHRRQEEVSPGASPDPFLIGHPDQEKALPFASSRFKEKKDPTLPNH